MNKEIIKKYRELLTAKLNELPKTWQEKFIKIYGKPDTIAICRLDTALELIEDNLKRGPA